MGAEAGPRRLFIAAALPRGAVRSIAALIAELRGTAPDLRWTAAGNVHLTLRFLGAVPRAETPLVEAAMAGTAAAAAPFPLRLGGLGTFGGRNPRVLWLEADAPELRPLADGLDDALAAAGFAPRDGAFRPHITLARVRRRTLREAAAALRAMAAAAPPLEAECTIEQLELVHSTLAPNGPIYRTIASARLGRVVR